MDKWIPVTEKLPDIPQVGDEQSYLVTEEGRSLPFVAFFSPEGKWINPYYFEFPNIIAWMPMPGIYKPPKKYRWRLNPEGYGFLREVYLTAVSPALTLAEWDIPVDKNTYKNVFTEEEFDYLAERWEFDPCLFVKEDPGES